MTLPDLRKPRPGDSCLLCGEKPCIVVIFAPDDPVAWGASGGRGRVFRYCLCSNCKGRPDTPEYVEKVILAELSGGGVINAD